MPGANWLALVWLVLFAGALPGLAAAQGEDPRSEATDSPREGGESGDRDRALAPFLEWCGIPPDSPRGRVARVDWEILRAEGYAPWQLEAVASVPMGRCRNPSFRAFVHSSGRIPVDPPLRPPGTAGGGGAALAPGTFQVLDRQTRRHTFLIYPGEAGMLLSSPLVPAGAPEGADRAFVGAQIGVRLEGYARSGTVVRVTGRGVFPIDGTADGEASTGTLADYEVSIGLPLGLPGSVPRNGDEVAASSDVVPGPVPSRRTATTTPGSTALHQLALATGHRGAIVISPAPGSTLYLPSFHLGLMLRRGHNLQVTFRRSRGMASLGMRETSTHRRFEVLTVTAAGRICPVGPRVGGLVDLQLMRNVITRPTAFTGPVSLRVGLTAEVGHAFAVPGTGIHAAWLPAPGPYASVSLLVGFSTAMLPQWPDPPEM